MSLTIGDGSDNDDVGDNDDDTDVDDDDDDGIDDDEKWTEKLISDTGGKIALKKSSLNFTVGSRSCLCQCKLATRQKTVSLRPMHHSPGTYSTDVN